MAGDWIKMRIELQSHPKIVRILSATQSDKFRVIGGLHAVWSVFDTHSEDGRLHGYTPELMDHVIGWPGFSGALVAVGWLVFDGSETLSMPEFVEHNGKSGKRRAEDQKRKRESRKCPQIVRNEPEEIADEKRTREEKRREEETPSVSHEKIVFDGIAFQNINGQQAIWESAYPAIDIRVEINKAAAWLVANPKNKKSNYARFLTNWLSKAQDKAPKASTAKSAPQGWTPPKTGDTRNHPMYGHPERFVEGVGWELAG